MNQEPSAPGASTRGWQARQLGMVCVVCLAVGGVAGYLLRGSAPVALQAPAARAVASASPTQTTSASPSQIQSQQMPHKMPTLDDMKRMADVKAAPLVEQLKSDPRNPRLQNQIGLIYKSAHQFGEAAGYFERSLLYDPKNIGVRADYASCLYYTGDVDGAIVQLDKSLAYDPKHAGTLMNIGIIRWRGKNDVDGAVAAWEKLLQYHPDFPQKEMVQHMITQAKQAKTAKTVEEGGRG
jgi:Tfp pilus assembly protein PilF